jgi:WD40 repeat protein
VGEAAALDNCFGSVLVSLAEQAPGVNKGSGRMNEQARPSRRDRVFLVTAAVLVWAGVGAALTGAAPNYSDWSAPVNLGPVVNSSGNDVGPAISKDGLSLYFNSNRTGSLGASDSTSARTSTAARTTRCPITSRAAKAARRSF